MKKCLVYGNCQAQAIKGFLKKHSQFNASYELVECPPVHLLTQDDLPRLSSIISDVDLFIHQPVSDTYKGIYKLSTNYLKAQLKSDSKVISFPVAYFTGYNPEMAYLKTKQGENISQPFPYHDTNLMQLYLDGKSVDNAIKILQKENLYSQEYIINNLKNTLSNLEN